MNIVVVDTSAIIRLYVPDGPLPDGLEEEIETAWRGETTLIIPELALAEIAQVLWKKEQAGYLKPAEVDEILTALMELPLEIVGHYDILSDALLLARKHRLSVYDSIFLASANAKKARLITADLRLKEAFEST
jgi:predicted nucleic acid-binding protein